jgi:hypothetical protein
LYLIDARRREMLSKFFVGYERARRLITAGTVWNLQVVLWALWTLAVAITGYLSWRAGVETLGLIIHCVVVGVVGLVVMTKIEMWLQPWRFID